MAKLDDPEQTRLRAAIVDQTFQGMQLLNGGAVVTVLAFLQTTWAGISPSLVRMAVIGAVVFIVGVVLNALSQHARYQTSLYLQFGPRTVGRRWRYTWLCSWWCSVLAFAAGAGVILWEVYVDGGPSARAERQRLQELELVPKRCAGFGFAPYGEGYANCQMRLTEAILTK
jgi:hypothetical protein